MGKDVLEITQNKSITTCTHLKCKLKLQIHSFLICMMCAPSTSFLTLLPWFLSLNLPQSYWVTYAFWERLGMSFTLGSELEILVCMLRSSLYASVPFSVPSVVSLPSGFQWLHLTGITRRASGGWRGDVHMFYSGSFPMRSLPSGLNSSPKASRAPVRPWSFLVCFVFP